MEGQTYTCVGCGISFTGHKRKYHDAKCRIRSIRLLLAHTCKGCGCTFYGRRKDYHSEQCRRESRNRARGPFVCKACGNPIEGRKRQYCSRQCPARRTVKHCVRPSCRNVFLARGTQTYCCPQCKSRYQEERKQLHALHCLVCGMPFVTRNETAAVCNHLYCQREQLAAQRAKGTSARRARLRGVRRVPYSRLDIFARDNWTCQECGRPVTRECALGSPEYATLDHIIPLVHGGDDAPDNVRCLCWQCNASKSDSLPSQPHAG